MTDKIANRSPAELAIYKAEYFFKNLGLTNEWEKEKAFALQAMQGNNSLANCTPDSIVKAVANVALTGLSLDPSRKLAFLIPRKGKAILQPSYRGLMKSVTASGDVVAFEAKVVYKGDEFSFEEGSDPYIKHHSLDLREDLTDDDIATIEAREKDPYNAMRCAYSVAILPSGIRSFVIMPKWRIDKIFACAQGTDKPTSPWKKWPEEQIRKTVLAYHTKTLDVGEKTAAAVQLFHDNDGIANIANEVQRGALTTYERITVDQAYDLQCKIKDAGKTEAGFCANFNIETVEDLQSGKYAEAIEVLSP